MTAVMIPLPVLVLACDGDAQCPNQHEDFTYDPKVLRKSARRAGWTTPDKRHPNAQDLCRRHRHADPHKATTR